MTDINLTLYRFAVLLAFIFPGYAANAQLQANFTTDKPGGCSPVTVKFTNTSTGASANATYQWDFGNGNTSALPDAAATYVQEQVYNVTLTVTDGGKTAAVTKQVSVYKRPTVNFSFDVNKGCLPLPVNFTAAATAGDGSIDTYYWDFGDGYTAQTSLAQIQHIYNLSQNTSVGLTVKNSYGCYTSIEKNAVEVLPELRSSFHAVDTFLCTVSDPVSFINTSVGPGTLSYTWDFGDGTTSNVQTPSHVYAKKGIYTIQLNVSSSLGCTAISRKVNYINAANFALGFTVPKPVCLNSYLEYKDTSTIGATNKQWFVDGFPAVGYYVSDTALYNQFYFPGNHTIQLTADFGKCKLENTQQITVESLPKLDTFIMDIAPYCKLPGSVNFRDTTTDAVEWEWRVPEFANANPISTKQSFSYEFINGIYSDVMLTVKNAAGCTSAIDKLIRIEGLRGGIQEIKRTGCDSIAVKFRASTNNDSIVSYQWDFGDGTQASQIAEPTHTYTKSGNYTVTLNFVTSLGCTGTLTNTDVNITRRPHADFSNPSGNTICGNTLTKFISNSSGDYWTAIWEIAKSGSNNYEILGFNSDQIMRFPDTGLYNVKLILLSNEGAVCNDTMTKLDFVKILPAIPKIKEYLNTCDGSRGLVRFTENSIDPLTWAWDFGDNTSVTYASKKDTVYHTYSNTGYYNVKLTVTNGACTLADSIYTAVLLKQHSLLSLAANQVCTNGNVKLWSSNYDLNPDPHFIDAYDWDGFSVTKFEYGDGSTFSGNYERADTMGYWNPWYTQLTAFLSDFKPFETSLRLITSSAYFGCSDTTNYVPLKINGPKAGFTINGSPCFDYPVILQDASTADNSFPIKTWEWNFGDGTSDAKTQSGSELHLYELPGQYNVQLKVTDGNGCFDTVSHYVNPSGPQAAFSYSPANVTPNNQVSFINNTNNFNSNNTLYAWQFGDGNTSTDFEPKHTYTKTGTYTLMLIATNPVTQCKDTTIQIINVKIINTEFSFTKSYVSDNTCPPVIVHLTNTSVNANSVSWDFGDGSVADNQNNPSHTYYEPGVYKITMYGFGYNGTKDTTVDSIIVRAPNATLNADRLSGCLSQNITLSATVNNASYITWDFADGNIQQTQDSFAIHQYATPGLYNPSLILLDSGGCYLTAKLPDTIIIDKLELSLPHNKHYCDAALVSFEPTIVSVAADSYHKPLTYHWNFGTGKPADTANIERPTFNYTNPGRYLVSVNVQSLYGCIKQVQDSIIVSKGSKGSITGPADVCRDASAQFSGQATNNVPGITWQWNLANGNTSTQQNPAAVIYNDTGNYRIQLVVTNDGCADTTWHQMTVHNKPVINAQPRQASICLGQSITLSAQGGITYAWSPAASLSNSNIATPVASPAAAAKYTVKVTNSFGCFDTDSVSITVVQPFTIKTSPGEEVCFGTVIQLSATGADTYKWINNTTGLNNTQIANPVATPLSTTMYTVVGYDAAHCFADTANINIAVNPIPVLNHQPDVEVLGGTTVQLQATGSADIIRWNWTPSDYLSCTNCAAPVSTPLLPVNYIVTGTTAKGCAAADTISVKLICAISKVYTPASFSPNNDGKNDVFTIFGTGVSNIKWLHIYNRYGELVFEKKNLLAGNHSNGWDGTIKGNPATPGTYVYMAELSCASGEVFQLRGTVILVR